MSRSGYSDDYADDDNLSAGRWHGWVASSIRGKVGQAFIKEMLVQLEAMPIKELAEGVFVQNQLVCGLGSVCKSRNIDTSDLEKIVQDFDDCDSDYLAKKAAQKLGITQYLAAEIMFQNDEGFWYPHEADEKTKRSLRHSHLVGWCKKNIKVDR